MPRVPRVPCDKELRVERRLWDYGQVLEEGTPSQIGTPSPVVVDRRDAIREAMKPLYLDRYSYRWTPATIAEVDSILDEAWNGDRSNWPRRLKTKFLDNLQHGSLTFGRFVDLGCQPDCLALRFYRAATAPRWAPEQQAYVHRELDTLDDLLQKWREVTQSVVARSHQLGEYLSTQSLRVIPDPDAPGGAEMNTLAREIEGEINERLDDHRRMRWQLDGRRDLLRGHAIEQLSTHVRQVTGHYHDKDVETVLNATRSALGFDESAPGTLKRQRARRLMYLQGRPS